MSPIVDFHAHILPGSDHGCRDVAMALRQLDLAAEAGVDLVLGVSHYYAHVESVEQFLQRRDRSFACLREEISGCRKALPEVIPGAEVLVCVGLEHMEELPALCAADTDCLLLEMPFGTWNRRLMETMEALAERKDIRIVLTHVDRYQPEAVEELFCMGYEGQLNAEALAGALPRRTLLRWVQEGHICALGSDIHGTGKAYRDFRKAERRLGQELSAVMRRSAKLLGYQES